MFGVEKNSLSIYRLCREKDGDGTWKAKNSYDGHEWNYIDELFAKQAVERKIRLMLIPSN
jgi:hypothetical protein